MMTGDDVRAAAEAAFPEGRVSGVMELLSRYGTEPHERERERVQLATLKLSEGDEVRLRDLVNLAKQLPATAVLGDEGDAGGEHVGLEGLKDGDTARTEKPTR
ncbi:MAG TPA: hypothetical protein VGB86_08715 [Methylomirabilota bacterium]|jgi:hypothetical protein